MTQLISNVLMQPNPNAVERLTLVEKLEQKESEVSQMMQADDAPFPYHYMAGKLNAFREIVNIVKQHQAESGWVRCAERLPKNPMFYLVDEEGEYFKARYFKDRWETSSKLRVYPEFWFDGKIGNPRKNIPVVLSKQPPSEVQDD